MKKLKIKNIIIAITILIIVLFSGIKYFNHINSNYYKLKQIGYNDKEIEIIEKNLNKYQVIDILDKEYSEFIVPLINEKYFIFNNMERYLNYYSDNKDKKINNIIAIVNTNVDKGFYEIIKQTDTSKGNLMLVNKFYKLDKDFTPNDLVDISLQYSYNNNSISEIVYENYINMWHAAKNEKDFTLIVTSSYRNYETQEELHERYRAQGGLHFADSIAARPGHSEHQVGLALDIVSFNKNFSDFINSEEALWLKENAHNFGFILRYPKEKQHITGYSYEPWHYRYVGNEVAQYIYENNITFDEYYAFYIKNK